MRSAFVEGQGRSVSRDAMIEGMLANGAPVAIGVSGGKDSQAAAIATIRYLDEIGHTGERILVHSDLGSVEWDDSLPACERLAEALGVELLVVRRAAGGMMERWEARWASSVRRYENLETVTLVLPWSVPNQRFCTSELKTQVILSALRKRWATAFVNVTGIRRQESARRATRAVADLEKTGRFATWNPLADWSIEDVFAEIAAAGQTPHMAYATYGLSRVSCRFCIMSSEADIAAAAAAAEAHGTLLDMVGLEARSTFSFQGARWLADAAPEKLPDALRAGITTAKVKAAKRKMAESKIGKGMLYVKNWPTRQLSDAEADTLGEVRREVGEIMGFSPRYLGRTEIQGRYDELMAEKEALDRRVAKRAKREVTKAGAFDGLPLFEAA